MFKWVFLVWLDGAFNVVAYDKWQLKHYSCYCLFWNENMNSKYYGKRFEAIFLHLHPRAPKLSIAATAKYITKSEKLVRRYVQQYICEKNVNDQPKEKPNLPVVYHISARFSALLSCSSKIRTWLWIMVANGYTIVELTFLERHWQGGWNQSPNDRGNRRMDFVFETNIWSNNKI